MKMFELAEAPLIEQENVYQKFLSTLILEGVEKYVTNVKTNMILYSIGNQEIPITVNEEEYDNSFVCSPFSHYVSYGAVLMEKVKRPFFKNLLMVLFQGYGYLMKKGCINQVVIVNNWLFTTNPLPHLSQKDLKTLLEELTGKFPNHAILFRSVTKEANTFFFESLQRLKFDLLASRFVYFTDGKDPSVFETRLLKSDLRALKASKYKQVSGQELTDDDLRQMVKLYQTLYIQKYSTLNPQFTFAYIKLAHTCEILHFKALKEGDQVIGTYGYFYQGGVMISPFFGYNPEKSGLYRMLSTLLLLEAQQHQALFNQSAGGSFFKKIRRAQGHFEYTALYTDHLSWKRKLPWKFLKLLTNTLGAFIMRRY